MDGVGTIHGHVTGSDNVTLFSITVSAYSINGQLIKTAQTDPIGEYTLSDLPPGQYKLLFVPPTDTLPGFSNSWRYYAMEWYNNALAFELAQPIDVSQGSTQTINSVLLRGAVIEATMTDADTGETIKPSGVNAWSACDNSGFIRTIGAQSDANGNGTVKVYGQLPGTYALEMFGWGSDSVYAPEFYQDKLDRKHASLFTITSEMTRVVIRETLNVGGHVSGTVIGSNGETLNNGVVKLLADDESLVTWSSVNAGTYSMHRIRPGSYVLKLEVGGYANQYYSGKTTFANAERVAVTSNQTLVADFQAQPFVVGADGTLTGRITDSVTSLPIGYALIVIFDANQHYVGEAHADADGLYQKSLQPGTYRLLIYPSTPESYAKEASGDKATVESAIPITVTSDQTATYNAALEAAGAIEGVVTAQDTGQPLSYVTVRVLDENNHEVSLGESLVTDFTGRFATQRELKPGKYRLSFERAPLYGYNCNIVKAYRSIYSGGTFEFASGQEITVAANFTGTLTQAMPLRILLPVIYLPLGLRS